MRYRNTDRTGRSFNPMAVQAVWNKGHIVPAYDPAQIRKDDCGAFIKRSDYGNTDSQFGWEIDHIKPIAKGGSDELINLQPLQWENNRHKGDDYPNWTCAIKAA